MRGTCPVCGYRLRLRKDGLMGAHRMYGSDGSYWYHCNGGGSAPKETK